MSPDHPLAGFFIGPERLRAFALEATEHAAKLAADSTSLTPALLVLTRECPDADEQRTVYLLAVDFNEHDEKHDTVFALGANLYQQRTFPVAVALLSEAWTAPQKDGVQPRDNPERREGVIVAALGLDRKTSSLFQALVTRGADEKMTLGPFEEVGPATMPLVDRFYQGFFSAFQKWAAEQSRST